MNTNKPPGSPVLGLKMPTMKSTIVCVNCQHCVTDPEKVKAHLRTKGITEASSGAPGEHTIARDLEWDEIIPKLDLIGLCMKDAAECELVHKAATCPHWAPSTGRIWVSMKTPGGGLVK